MQPTGPNPNLDFIMKDQPKPKKSLGLPSLGIPRFAMIIAAVIVAILILVIVVGLISGSGKVSSGSLVGLGARAQEMARTANLASQDSQDSNLQALATTVSATMTSQEGQLNAYLSKDGQKVDPKALSASQNPATDQLFQTAAQNDNLTPAYANYLVANLNSYKIELANQAAKASSPALKNILANDIESVQVLIDNASPLQRAQPSAAGD